MCLHGVIVIFEFDGYIRERLDRAAANPAWCDRFPGYKVTNGDPTL